MGKKIHRVPYHLDSKGVSDLPREELSVILRGADDLIMKGGRSLLSKVLKGSRQKRILELGLDESPVYGYYKDLHIDDVMARIDWVILNGYLNIAYDYRLPMLVYTDKGWEIEMETGAEELLNGFDDMVETTHKEHDMSYLKDRNRGMILLLLDKVETTGDEKYIPLLESWEQVDYKKVRKRIREVIANLVSGVS